jgi:hypothetical protein
MRSWEDPRLTGDGQGVALAGPERALTPGPSPSALGEG